MSINIHGKEYITVAERVRAIHESGDRFDIRTEVLSTDPVVIKATVDIEEKGVFTGISAANPNKAIEKQSPYEVAETSAVGRALGFAGYGLVDDIATADEMIKAGVSPSPEVKKVDLDDLKPEDFVKPTKTPLRDTLGHTYCDSCGKVVSKKIEDFSFAKYGKILCFGCQEKEEK